MWNIAAIARLGRAADLAANAVDMLATTLLAAIANEEMHATHGVWVSACHELILGLPSGPIYSLRKSYRQR